MDLFSLAFLLLILVASGFVAFAADRLGKKLGKKRLSIWGLRPKHVATLGTVVMGVLVSLLTIAFVAAASKDARIWLREGRQLLIQRDQLRKENERLLSERDRRAQESKDLTQANERLKGSNGELQRKLVDQQKSLELERGRLVKAQLQRGKLETEATRLQGEASRLSALVASLRKSQSANEAALASSRRLLAQNQSALRAAQSSLKSYRAQISQAQINLKTSKANWDVAYRNWQDAVAKSTETYRKLQDALRELEETQAKVDAATARITELTTQREKAEQDLAATQARYNEAQNRLSEVYDKLVEAMTLTQSQEGFLNSAIKNSRTEAMTFRAREEVARVLVPGGSDADGARAALTSLIRTARLQAADRGAKSGKSNGQTIEVADIFDRQDPRTKAVISSEELKNAVVTRAAGRVEDQVLVATSSLNAFAGEPVSLEISVLPNPLIYHQGEMLSEARIDGSLPEDEIFGQISEFVRSRVRERATQDRMIPRAGTDAPFGVVPPANVFALVRDVKRVGRAVRVQAFAGDDIHAADPLRLEFRLK